MKELPNIKSAARKLCERLERNEKTGGQILVAYDFDGTVLDTMAAHGILAAECMHAEFGTEYEEAKRLYHSTTGIPFPKQLEKIYPNEPAGKREACEKKYRSRKTDEVYRATEPFPEAKMTFEETKVFGTTMQTIASSTEARLIRELTDKYDLTKYFEMIWGCDEGDKNQHMAHMRGKYHVSAVIFVGDSASDVKLKEKGADMTIGKAGPPEKGMLTPEQLVEAGADYASEDLLDIPKILKVLGALHKHTLTG